jgi:tripartite-type tricarboxylate transporter receptor subunit TctC
MIVMGLLIPPRSVHHQRGQPDAEGEYLMTDFPYAKRWLIALLAVVAIAAPAHAQTFPSKTIRVIVPYPPGGSIDLTARVIAKNLQDSVGQNVIVENKPGANAAIGIEALLRSDPDGHTLVILSDSPSRSTSICRGSTTIRSPTWCRLARW